MARVTVFMSKRIGRARWLLPFLFLVVVTLVILSRTEQPPQPFITQEAPLSATPDSSAETSAAVVTVAFGNGQRTRSFSGEVIDGMTAADALTVAGLAGNFDVSFTDHGLPERIDGVSGSWHIEYNRQPLTSSLFERLIVPGDILYVAYDGGTD